MKKPSKKRNPQDATLRNIRAIKKRVESLENQVRILVRYCANHIREREPNRRKKR